MIRLPVLPVLFAMLCCAASAQAAVYTVTNLADGGNGSLRAAVLAANASPGADTVRFQTGLAGTIQLASEIRIADSLVLEGPGAEVLAIAGTPTSRIFRLERASGARSTTTLSGLTLREGRASDGGAIFGEDENLVVHDAVLRDNASTSRGGAIRLQRGDLTLIDVEFAGNRAGPGNNATGGALYFSIGTLRMKRALVRGNAAEHGGGIYLGTPAPQAVIEDSAFVDNTSRYAGGAISAGTTMPTLQIARSSFIGNSAVEPMGAAIIFGGSTSPGSSPGVIENSTFSGNFTTHTNGRGILAVTSGILHLRNSTLAHNRTASAGGAAAAEGGAVWVGNATLTIDSTLFSHNTHGAPGTLSRVDISPSSPSTRTLNVAHSLLHTTPAAGLINGINSANQFDTDARLFPLAVEGSGFTPVHPIPIDSPAIDAGSNPAHLATDQRGRGFPRSIDLIACRHPSLARTDAGAYEYRTDTIFCHGFQG
jgi:hypothetical protein